MHIALGGILPFGSIFIEMYFIFTSFYKYYYVYGFMLLVYLILIIVTVCVTIVSTYFLLNSEDYRWQWTSFLSAASTAGYVYLYAVYYFIMKTKMSGKLSPLCCNTHNLTNDYENNRVLPNHLLFRVHGDVLSRSGGVVRYVLCCACES